MDFILNEVEVRVLGSLVEKKITLPEYYPLSLNALTGVVSGTPTTAGSYTVTATATTVTPPSSSILTFVWTVT